MTGRLMHAEFLFCFTLVFLQCTNQYLHTQETGSESGALAPIAWQPRGSTVCEPGSCNRPAIAMNLNKDILEMVRLEHVDDATGSRKSYLRNYYYYSGSWRHQSTVFGDGEDSGDPAMVVNKNLGNLEVVVRRGDRMRHYWRDETSGAWNTGKIFGENVRSDPAMICNIQNNNLEVIVREGPRLRHYWRDNATGNWFIDPEVFANDLSGSPAMVQSSDGNLHVVTRSKERQIHHYERLLIDGRYSWQYREIFGFNIKGEPTIAINSDNNRLQVIVKEGVGTTGLKHYEYSGAWNQVAGIVSKMELYFPAIVAFQNHNFTVVCLDDPINPCMVSNFNYMQN
jgi:hypothetical protein